MIYSRVTLSFFIMEEYIKYFETHEEYEEYVAGGTMEKPNISYCEDVKDVHYNPYVREYDKEYLEIVKEKYYIKCIPVQ